MNFSFSRLLYEFNYQHRAVEKIEDILPTTIEHIFKCILMPNDRAINHHIHDVINWLHQMDEFADVKTTKGRPSQKLLLREYKPKFESMRLLKHLKRVRKKYEIKSLPLADEDYFEFIRNFFEEFFLDIENNIVDEDHYEEILRKKVNSLRKL